MTDNYEELLMVILGVRGIDQCLGNHKCNLVYYQLMSNEKR